MATHAAVSVVTQALRAYLAEKLEGELPPPFKVETHLLAEKPSNLPTLTLFLYDIAEDTTLRNAPPVVTIENKQRTVRRAPVPLILRYMITPWSENAEDTYRMAGCVVAALGDARTLLRSRLGEIQNHPPDIDTALAGIELVSISMAHLSLEEKSKVWWAIQMPFRLSLIYEMRVVPIDLFQDAALEAGRVRSRELDGRLPAVMS